MSFPIAQDVSLPNTLALTSRAQKAMVATSICQLKAGIAACSQESVFVLGSGSNVVLPESLAGLVVVMRIKGIVERSSAGDARVFDVGAGESWQGFVRFCIGQGLGGGIENLTLIPGTVGAAPIQNIGAYGVEVAQFIQAVQVLDLRNPKAAPIWVSAKDCAFGYRDSLFKRQPGCWVVTQVRFELQPYEAGHENLQYAGVGDALQQLGCTRLNPASVSEAIAMLRRSKLPDPRTHPNAGSFFKNPIFSKAQLKALPAEAAKKIRLLPSWPHGSGRKLAAAALIDQVGFKRSRKAGVGVWFRQPLVLVNYEGADAGEVGHFADDIKQAVFEQFGVRLEQEPIQVPSG